MTCLGAETSLKMRRFGLPLSLAFTSKRSESHLDTIRPLPKSF